MSESESDIDVSESNEDKEAADADALFNTHFKCDSDERSAAESDEDGKSPTLNPLFDESSLQSSVLTGSFTDLPKRRKNVIRIFLSSTFTGECHHVSVVMSFN